MKKYILTVCALFALTITDANAFFLNKDIVGKDVNNNGVRDDVEKFIDKLGFNDIQKLQAYRYSKAIQSTLTVNVEDYSAVLAVVKEMGIAGSCFMKTYEDPVQASRVLKRIQRQVKNTMARNKAYDKFDRKMDGTAIGSPRNFTCEKMGTFDY